VTEDTFGLLSAPKWETSQECSCFCPVDPEAINPEESNGAMEDMMTTSSSVMQQVSLTGNDYLLVYNVFSLVVASMFAAFVYFLMNASQVAKQYRTFQRSSADRGALDACGTLRGSDHVSHPHR
jgi:hypothetical protein